MTQEIEKLTVEEVSATPVDKIVPNSNLASSNIAEQETSSVGGQDDLKTIGSDGTGLSGVQTGLTGYTKKLVELKVSRQGAR